MAEPLAHENFDPYHKWLGISPKDQPPHYYRLLAIDLFESDPDVISAAADKQMAFIRSFQTGKNATLSQKILNEIATARVCLLNVAKKAEYDHALRARMAVAASRLKKAEAIPVVAGAPADEETGVVAELADSETPVSFPMEPGASKRSPFHKKKSNKATLMPLVALGAMLVVCVVAIAVVMSRTPESDVSQVAEDRVGNPPRNAESAHAKQAAQVNKPLVPANTTKPAPSTSSLQPSRSGDGSDTASPAKPPDAGKVHGTSENEANHKSSDKIRPEIKPGIGDDPSASKSAPAPEPETSAKPAEVEKGKTLAELDKQLSDAKTAEDYQAVAGEAFRAAGKAIDDHQQDAAKQLILKALIAARKSGDSKLIVKATRALTKPELVKEILAEKDKQDQDSAAPSRPLRDTSSARQASGGGPLGETPATPGRRGPTVPVTKRVGLFGTQKLGALIGPVTQGTLITLQYDEGAWENPVTHESINPDDASQNVYRVAIATRQAPLHVFVLPPGTAARAFQWRADRDYDAMVLRCHIFGANNPLDGKVYYRMTVTPPGQ